MEEKIPQTQEELMAQFEEQIGFLESSVGAYDNGNESEAKRMALAVRILAYDRGNSKSLLGQLGMKEQKFISTCAPMFEPTLTAQRGLIYASMGGSSSKYRAMLDDVPEKEELDFEDWWNEKIFLVKETNGEESSEIFFTRKDIILAVADQDGGAHVDPELKASYQKLSRQNLLGNMMSDGDKWTPYNNPERATIRQIAHEVLKTFVDGYEKMPNLEGVGLILGNMQIQTSSSTIKERKHGKIGRNDPCPCGKGKKYKKCCGR